MTANACPQADSPVRITKRTSVRSIARTFVPRLSQAGRLLRSKTRASMPVRDGVSCLRTRDAGLLSRNAANSEATTTVMDNNVPVTSK